jgi:hypothetical protein
VKDSRPPCDSLVNHLASLPKDDLRKEDLVVLSTVQAVEATHYPTNVPKYDCLPYLEETSPSQTRQATLRTVWRIFERTYLTPGRWTVYLRNARECTLCVFDLHEKTWNEYTAEWFVSSLLDTLTSTAEKLPDPDLWVSRLEKLKGSSDTLKAGVLARLEHTQKRVKDHYKVR